LVIAADGGAATALSFGLEPRVVIGDLDSIDAQSLAELRRRGVAIEPFPRDKDQTDGQLAIERAIADGADALYLLGFLGGPRLDQSLANVFLLTRCPVPCVLVDDRNEVRLARAPEEVAWTAEADEIVSIVPLSDTATVTTHGLRWPLVHAELPRGDTRSISNEPLQSDVSVSIEGGLALITRHFGPPAPQV
jgi:thiamine pyrophosphokinase